MSKGGRGIDWCPVVEYWGLDSPLCPQDKSHPTCQLPQAELPSLLDTDGPKHWLCEGLGRKC